MRSDRARHGHSDPRRWETVDPLDAVCDAIAETGASLEDVQVKPGSLPGDPRALRGIPCVGGRGSIGGAVPGTKPEWAVLRLDKR